MHNLAFLETQLQWWLELVLHECRSSRPYNRTPTACASGS
jgi:hypothetical protein